MDWQKGSHTFEECFHCVNDSSQSCVLGIPPLDTLVYSLEPQVHSWRTESDKWRFRWAPGDFALQGKCSQLQHRYCEQARTISGLQCYCYTHRKQACHFTSEWESSLEGRVRRTLFHVQVDFWKPGSVVQNGYPEQNLISVWRQKTRPYDVVGA